MNRLTGKISNIEVDGGLSLVSVQTAAGTLTAIVIDTPDTCAYLRSGHEVQAIFKESEVVIGKDTAHSISLRNRIRGNVTAIEKGTLLSKITIQSEAGTITSHITTNAANQLELAPDMMVYAMIKTNEVMLSD